MLKTLADYIDKQQWKDLKHWLNTPEIAEHLKDNDVLPDYIYYLLEHKFNTHETGT